MTALLPRPLVTRAIGGDAEAIFLGGETREAGLARLLGKPAQLGPIPLAVTVGAEPAIHFSVLVPP